MATSRPRGAIVRTRVYARTAGVLLLVLGTAGFVVTGFSGFWEADSGNVLLGLRLNPALNLVHLAAGAALLRAGAGGAATARTATGVVGILVLGLGLTGLWLTDRPDLNVLAVNTTAVVLHLTVGTLALVVAALPGRTAGT